MRGWMTRGAFRLGILLMLTIGLVLPALTPGAGAQATPEAEPTATVAPDPTAEPTIAPEPTVIVDPTDEPTAIVEPPAEPTTVPEATPAPTEPPAENAARSGIMAAGPYTVELTGPATVARGDQLTYTVTVTNTSGLALDELLMGGLLPGDLIWSIVPAQTTASCSVIPPSSLRCNTLAVATGAILTATVTAQVPDTVACGQVYSTELWAIGMYVSTPPDNLPIYLPEVRSNTVTTEVTCAPPQAYIAEITGPARIRPGDQLTYEFAVTNVSDQSIEIYFFGGRLPAGLKWSFVEDKSFMPCQIRDQGGPFLVCISPDMRSLERSVVVVTAKVPANIDCNHRYSTQVETYGIYSAGPQVILPTVFSNTLTTDVACQGPRINLATSGTYVAPTADSPLGAIAWNLTVTNIGDGPLTDVSVAGLDGLDCDPVTAGSQVTIASLAEDAQAVTCTVTSPVTFAQGGGTVTTIASVLATAPSGSDPVTDSASAGVAVPDLSGGIVLVKSVEPTTGQVGEGTTLTYTVTVTNAGHVTLDDVTVTDALPGLTWDAANPEGVVGDLAPGDSATLTATYVVTGADATAGTVVNEAIATGQHPTCREGDDTPSIADCTVVSAPSAVSVQVGDGPASPPTVEPTSSVAPGSPEVVTQLPETGSGPGGGGGTLVPALMMVLLATLGLLGRMPARRR